MNKITKTLAFLILILILNPLINSATFAQNRSVIKSKASKKKGKKYQVFFSKEKKKQKKRKFDPLKNAALQKGKTVVRPTTYYGVSEKLSEIAKRKQKPLSKDKGKFSEGGEKLILLNPSQAKKVGGPNSKIQTQILAPSTATVGTEFEGLGTGEPGVTGIPLPPDTILAVGPNHIIQWINSRYTIFDKSGVTIAAPVFGFSLFSGLGNVCETTNRGDPIVQYDRLADRWFLSQFAFDISGGSIIAPYLQCIAISTTNDPTGSYHRYTISFGTTPPEGFNDYGKLGIWNDAYYTSYIIFEGTPAGNFSGVSLCASDRTKMLVGDATATTLCAPTAKYGDGDSAFLPADLDGNELPTDQTRGGVFVALTDTQKLQMLRLKPNFAGGTVTLTNGFGGAVGIPIDFPIGATTLTCNDFASATTICIDQPETTNKVDTLGDRLMQRLTYRNRGGIDSLIVNHSVDPDGAATRNAAIRWYEIRNPLNDPNDSITARRPYIYQNGTYDPGSVGDRWMGSAAMNKFGDILIGYSKADEPNSLKPSIAIAGRKQSDTLSTLQAENIILTGTGSQTGSSRWGDYSTMQVDPSDDTTFWYTTEYLSVNGNFNARTRIFSISFPTTAATSDGDFNTPSNWSNGVPTSTKSGTIPAGRIMTINADTTVGNLSLENGGTLVMNANLDIDGSLLLGDQINTGLNTLGLGCNATVSGASASNYIIGNIRKDFCSTGEFSYPTGTLNGYSPAVANVTTLTTNPSSLEIKANQTNRAGMDSLQSAQRFWNITETGDLTANLTFNYLDPTDVNGTEANYKLFRFVGATGFPVTPFTLDTTANTISTNGVSTFSDWAVGNLVPTAAPATVSGIVLTSKGRSISRATISLIDSQGNIRTARSNNFGYFRFNNVTVGETYTISAIARGRHFSPQVLTVDEDIKELRIISTN